MDMLSPQAAEARAASGDWTRGAARRGRARCARGTPERILTMVDVEIGVVALVCHGRRYRDSLHCAVLPACLPA